MEVPKVASQMPANKVVLIENWLVVLFFRDECANTNPGRVF